MVLGYLHLVSANVFNHCTGVMLCSPSLGMGGKNSRIWEEPASPFEEFIKKKPEEDMEVDGNGGGASDGLVKYVSNKMKSKKGAVTQDDIDKILAGTPIHGAEVMCKSVSPQMGGELYQVLVKSQEKGIECEPLSQKETLRVYLAHKGALVTNDWMDIQKALEDNSGHLSTLPPGNTAAFLHSILMDGQVNQALEVAHWIQDWACHFAKPAMKKIELYLPDAGGDAGSAYYVVTEGKFQVELAPSKGAGPAALPTPGGVEEGDLKHAEVEIPEEEGKPIVIMFHIVNSGPPPSPSSPKPSTIKTFALTTAKNWMKKEVKVKSTNKVVTLQNLTTSIRGGDLMNPKIKVEGEYKHCLLTIHGDNLLHNQDVLSCERVLLMGFIIVLLCP